jgi:mRNA interferase RelE/StbE
MRVEFLKDFEKQLKKEKSAVVKNNIYKVVQKVIAAQTLSTISNCKKLEGHKTAFRIKSGDLRIGFFFENETILFAAFDFRKDIYKWFP